MLMYNRCNIVILMVATSWLMLSFSSCIMCGFDSYTVLFKYPQRKFNPPPRVGGWGRGLLKDNISHAVAAIKITMLHRVAAFIPRKYSWYSFLLETESTPGPYCDRKDFISMKNPLTAAGIEPATFRFVAQHLTHCATAVPIQHKINTFIGCWCCLRADLLGRGYVRVSCAATDVFEQLGTNQFRGC